MSIENDPMPDDDGLVVERYDLTSGDAIALLRLPQRGDTHGVRAILAGLDECRTSPGPNHRRR